jgi:DNA-binding NarL/FixJ family response regulator
MDKIKVLIADDHAVVRAGLQALLERESFVEICGQARNGREAVDLCLQLKPHVLVLDLNMSELNGLEVVSELKRLGSKTEILVFSAHQAEEMVEKLFEAGAKSYVRKIEAPGQLVAAIQSLSQHKPYLTPEVSSVLFARFRSAPSGPPGKSEGRLTRREREIVQLVAEGASNKEMALKLGISLRTVEKHRANLLRKLNLGSVADLVRYAIRNKIIEP